MAILLPERRHAFARMMNDGEYEIFRLMTTATTPPLDDVFSSGVAFHQSGTDDPINDGSWPVIGHRAFDSDEAATMPPQATSYDASTGTWFTSQPRVMVRGDARPATAAEVWGLDVWSYCDDKEAIADVIEDRLVHGNDARYKVRKT